MCAAHPTMRAAPLTAISTWGASHGWAFAVARQQIEHLQKRGVTFDIWSKGEALLYLQKHTNYFRLKSYKSGFERVSGEADDGRYIHLDFAMLVDLSVIDMLLRNELPPMTLDIEHFAKVPGVPLSPIVSFVLGEWTKHALQFS